MPRVGFEPTISAGERPKTYALDRGAIGIGVILVTNLILMDPADVKYLCLDVAVV